MKGFAFVLPCFIFLSHASEVEAWTVHRPGVCTILGIYNLEDGIAPDGLISEQDGRDLGYFKKRDPRGLTSTASTSETPKKGKAKKKKGFGKILWGSVKSLVGDKGAQKQPKEETSVEEENYKKRLGTYIGRNFGLEGIEVLNLNEIGVIVNTQIQKTLDELEGTLWLIEGTLFLNSSQGLLKYPKNDQLQLWQINWQKIHGLLAKLFKGCLFNQAFKGPDADNWKETWNSMRDRLGRLCAQYNWLTITPTVKKMDSICNGLKQTLLAIPRGSTSRLGLHRLFEECDDADPGSLLAAKDSYGGDTDTLDKITRCYFRRSLPGLGDKDRIDAFSDVARLLQEYKDELEEATAHPEGLSDEGIKRISRLVDRIEQLLLFAYSEEEANRRWKDTKAMLHCTKYSTLISFVNYEQPEQVNKQ